MSTLNISTMKAMICSGPEQPMQWKDVPQPEPDYGEVLVRLRAAALNHRDLLIQQGRYVNLSYPIVPGSDGAGVIEQLGEGVSNHYLGEQVIINPGINWGDNPKVAGPDFKILGLPDNGCFAEYIIVPASALYPKPSYLSFEQAAAIPLSGLTAYRALVTRAAAQTGEKLLISGIGGGVALFILQFAVALGIEAYVTSGSDGKIQRAIEAGAKGGVNYRHDHWNEELKKMAGEFDIVIDSAAGAGFYKLLDVCKPGGRIVTHGATGGALNALMPHPIFLKQLNILGSTMGSPEDFAGMLKLMDDHKIMPHVDEVYTLEQANEALQRMQEVAQFGKIVLTI